MSSEAELLQHLSGASGSSRALYFKSGEHRLFGWLHQPTGSQADLGVVLCQPFGYEAICAHRGLRAFAEGIAGAGMPALRFDYLGCGDSPDIDPQAEQIQAWTQDILAAVDELRSRTGVRRVCLLGFRLGAMLATLAAAQSREVHGLILVSPIATGRRYLRELRTTRMAASLGMDPSEPQPDPQSAFAGEMEVSGFALSAATLTALGKVDVSTIESAAPLQTLIIEGNGPSATGAPESPGRTTRMALPGIVEMLMTPPQFAQVPTQILAATLAWLPKLSSPSVETGQSAARERFTDDDAGSELQANHWTERPVFFGSEGLLFGIVTKPSPGEARRRATILLNAGADHHVCASRLYVSMARHWARHGYFVLRMDLAGLGDSGTRPGRTEDEVFPKEAMEDIRAAVDFLRTLYGIHEVTLAGLCSGAYHTLRAAVAGLPINRVLMINPQNYFWRAGETLQGVQLVEVVRNPGVYRERMFSLSAWKRLMSGHVNVVRILKIYVQRPVLAAESLFRGIARRLRIRLPNDLGMQLDDVLARGIRVTFVFAKDEPGIGLLELQTGKPIERLAARCHIHIMSSGDHVFTRRGSRAIMEKIVSDELFARPEAVSGPAASFKTAGLKFE